MADVSIIISTNAEQASKEIKGLSNSVINASDKALKMTQAFDFLDRAFNKGKISANQYQNATSALDASEDALYSSIGKTTQAVQQQSSAAQSAAASVDKLADETEMLKIKYKAGYAASKQLSSATKELNAALKLGVLSTKQHKLQVAELGREYQRVGKYSKGFSAMQRMAGKSTNKFGMYSQQVGYQVGDFAVQVQSGTNALVAFGQQGTQLAGLLPGLAGAVLGIGLAIGTAVARSVLDAKKLEIDFKAVINELKKPLETIKPLVEAISGAFKFTGKVAVSVLSTIANNLDRVVLYIAVAGAAFGTKLVAGLIAARLATFSLAGAFAFLRKAILRTGIGAVVILVAEAIRMFLLLKKQLGGVGPLLDLLKGAFKEVLSKIGLYFMYLMLEVKVYFLELKLDALSNLSSVLTWVNKDFVNGFIGAFVGAIKVVSILVASIPDMFVAVFKSVKLAVANGVNAFTGVIGEGINAMYALVGAEGFEFKPFIDTSEMTSGEVGGTSGAILQKAKDAYELAAATEYVKEAQDSLAGIVTETVESMRASWEESDRVKAAMEVEGTAIGKLSAAYDALGKASDIDFGKMLTIKTDEDEDSSKSEDPIAKLKREIKLNNELIGMSKEKVTVLTQVRDIQKQLADDGKTYDEVKLVALVKYNEELKKQRAESQALADTIASSMETAMMSMVDGTKTVKDAFRDMARDIIKHLYKVLVVQQMVNALGGFMSGSSNPVIASIGGGLESYGSLDGGGYTGDAPRSGGLDGKGGFMAMMHPRETVIDHTKAKT
jgi:hypothetical protein